MAQYMSTLYKSKDEKAIDGFLDKLYPFDWRDIRAYNNFHTEDIWDIRLDHLSTAPGIPLYDFQVNTDYIWSNHFYVMSNIINSIPVYQVSLGYYVST